MRSETLFTNANNQPSFKILILLIGVLFLSACGEGGNNTSTPFGNSTNYTISGTVSGLTGSGLVLQNNLGDNLSISTIGAFSFATALTDGSAYSVSVLTQPNTPAQTCSVTNSVGTITGANISNILVDCIDDTIITPTYTVSGTISGLTGSGLVLQNNLGDNLSISTIGAFSFATALTDGSAYSVSVLTQPNTPAQTCSVTNSVGTITGANISNILVDCIDDTIITPTYTVSGTISGLTGSGLVLQNNTADDITITAGATSFNFPASLADLSAYDVTVLTQPSTPNQTCTVASGAGSIAGANITNVAVTCVDDPINTYTISGSITGLTGSGLVLENNARYDLGIAGGTSFSFPEPFADGSTYAVSVATQPTAPAQTCTVTTGTGTITGANITNIAIGCVDDLPLTSHTISVSVSGLTGSELILQNNLGDDLSIFANGPFSFASALNDRELYHVTVSGQPLAQHCTIANAIGKLSGADINDIQVTCVDIFASRQGIMESSLFGGSQTMGIAVGDVNGDGKPDVVIANDGHVNEVWFNDGERFVDSGQALDRSTNPDIPAQTFSIALGDIDGDGDLDIFSGDTSWHSIWVNDGTGFFTQTNQTPNGGPWELVVGDIDNDGDLDYVSADFNSDGLSPGGISVFTNNAIGFDGFPIGNGVFGNTQSFGTSDTSGIALAYINNDLFLDIVSGNTNSQGNRIWFNNGDGTFYDSGQSLGTASTSSIAAGDIDGDGDMDIVAGNGTTGASAANTVWRNDGLGNFTDTGQALGNSTSYAVVLEDINGDGNVDLLVGNNRQPLTNNGQPNKVWINDGTGNFTDSGQALGGEKTRSLKLADLDLDGDLDMVAGNADQQANVVYTNDGNGVFADVTQPSGLNDSTVSISLGDIDDDGDLDKVMADSWGDVRVRLNDSNGSFTEIAPPAYGEFSDSALADVDGDGDLDLALGAPASSMDGYIYPNLIYINNGSGVFTDTGQRLADGATESIAFGDIDADGDIDLVAGNEGANKIWLNDGAGLFYDSGQSLGAAWTWDIDLADIDGDSDLDIIAANVSGSSAIWLNDGFGVFTNSGQTPSSADSISLGDIDADGDLDLVMARGGSNRVWFNNAGSFFDSGQILIIDKGFTSAIELGDMDNDGDLDIVNGVQGVGGLTALPNKIWLNNGSGIYSDSNQTLGSDGTSSIALGDIDGDSDLDIVTGTYSGEFTGNYPESNRIYRNLSFTK